MAGSEFVSCIYYFPSHASYIHKKTLQVKQDLQAHFLILLNLPTAADAQLSSSNHAFSKTDLLCGKSAYCKDFCLYMALLFLKKEQTPPPEKTTPKQNRKAGRRG